MLFEPLFDVDSNGTPGDQAAFDSAKDRFGLERSPRNSFGWRHGHHRDFAAWENEFLQLDNPPAKGATPVDTVLVALELYAADMAKLTNDIRRPHSRFDIRYEDSFAALLPHLALQRQAAVLFSLRASARLTKDDIEGHCSIRSRRSFWPRALPLSL